MAQLEATLHWNSQLLWINLKHMRQYVYALAQLYDNND
jgi:hypothetical protein